MARRGRRSKRSAGKKRPHIPMALMAPLAADAVYFYRVAKDGLSATEMTNLTYMYSGWNGSSLDMGRLIQTYGKYVVGGVVSMGATKLGINRRIYKLTRGYVGI